MLETTQYQNSAMNIKLKSLYFVIGHSPCDTTSGLKSLDPEY